MYFNKEANHCVELTGHQGRSQGGPWVIGSHIYLIFIICHRPFCQICEKVVLRLDEHDDVIIETQKIWCLATYLSYCLLSEHCLATLR